MSFLRNQFLLGLGICLFGTGIAHAQVSKGHQILLNRGLQLQGLSQDDCYLHLDTYSNANYTSINWVNSPGTHSSRPDWMGAAPGFAWSRWAADETQMPPQITPYGGDETPYLPQLFALQLGDEWNLNDLTTRNRLVDWFNLVRTNWPNTILYHNNWGSQIGDAELADFYTRAQPDLLCFDTYPWQAVWDINQPDHIGAAIAGPPTGWYGDMRRYREHAKGAGVPLGLYRQTFHAVQDYDQHVFRDPSQSELRLNTFAALAFNAKFLTDFIYNTGAASLFTKTFNGSGDSVINATNGLYAEMTDINKRAQNFGRALLQLTPVYDLHNTNAAYYPSGFPPGPGSDNPTFPPSSTSSIMLLRGKTLSGGVTNFTSVPSGFIADPDVASSNPAGTGQAYTWWESSKNDPYLRGWVVTNKAAVKNDGLLGEAILAWFKPMDENLDGTNYNNEIYMMAVNALTSPTGTAADCMQQIRLNFIDVPATTNVIMLNSATGQLTTNNLPIVNTRRQLSVDLNGGDAVLFKFNTGAPFVGFLQPAPARLSVIKQSGNTVVKVEGTVGTRYLLQASSSVSSPSWTTLTNVVLTSSPYVFTENNVTGLARYYRAVGIRP